MLYGHIEEPRHRVDHVLRLRELQDETGGFVVFIPLRFHNDNNRLSHLPMAQPADVLKTFAVSRLMLDNFPHVKVFWVMHGLSTSQLALNFGADDMDGSVVEYKITHDADGFGTPDKLTRDDLLDLIRDAGFTPVERNTRYEVIREYDGPVPLAERRAEPQTVWSHDPSDRRCPPSAELRPVDGFALAVHAAALRPVRGAVGRPLAARSPRLAGRRCSRWSCRCRCRYVAAGTAAARVAAQIEAAGGGAAGRRAELDARWTLTDARQSARGRT